MNDSKGVRLHCPGCTPPRWLDFHEVEAEGFRVSAPQLVLPVVEIPPLTVSMERIDALRRVIENPALLTFAEMAETLVAAEGEGRLALRYELDPDGNGLRFHYHWSNDRGHVDSMPLPFAWKQLESLSRWFAKHPVGQGGAGRAPQPVFGL